jgi:DNA-binding MarR family transcriptional regulator
MKLNIIDELGELAIGARLRRMNDIFSKDVSRIYKDNGLDFETKHFILFYLISQRNGIGIMEIADELSLTHPAIINLAKELEKKGFIESEKSPGDARRRLLKLSRKGKRSLPAFQRVWKKIEKLNKQLMKAQQHHLLKAIEEMEKMLEDLSYYKRFQNF